MLNKDFVPDNQAALPAWAATFAAAAETNAATLGLSPAEVTGIKERSDAIELDVKAKAEAKAAAKQATDARNVSIRESISELRKTARKIKTKAGYTEALGKAMGIVGSDIEVDIDGYKPEVTAKPTLGHVRIEFTKKGIEAVHVYGRKQGQTNWQLLATDFHSPYVDTKPLTTPGIPETREYMCRGVLHDEEVGVDSDIVSALYTGEIAL